MKKVYQIKRKKKYKKKYLEEEKVENIVKNKSKESGIPYKILKQVMDRGIAAWKTGHRPGTNPIQWGAARINSFLTYGKTAKTADKDLFNELTKSQQDKIKND